MQELMKSTLEGFEKATFDENCGGERSALSCMPTSMASASRATASMQR